jgi:alkylation response protein AidB-like acyl-CoA dehydrogenase
MTDAGPVMIAAVFPTREAEIIDTWYTLGMRGTDSNDVAVKDLFVPTSRTYHLTPEFEPGRHFRGPLYRFPGVGEVGVIGAPALLAIARGAIDEFRDLARRKTPFGSMKTLRDRGTVQATLARAEGVLRSARALFYDTLAEAWERTVAGVPSSLEQRADLLLAAAHAVKSSAEVTESMHGLAGTSGIYTRSRLERHFRDAHTLRHHGFVSESKLETVGQVYLGVPPEFVMVAF